MTSVEMVERACLLEATARKPGNVHPGTRFVDLAYDDFVRSAAVVAPVIASVLPDTIGPTVLRAIQATRAVGASNINLGIVLLLTPLAAVPKQQSLADGLHEVLSGTNVADAETVYAAIRLAAPGGLGQVDDHDVSTTPTLSLTEAMRLAAERDLVAAQYATDYALVLQAAKRFKACLTVAEADPRFPFPWPNGPAMPAWEFAILNVFLELLATMPDSLIVRKCGPQLGEEARQRAAFVRNAGWPFSPQSWIAYADFDAWLRSDGHRRNPGTTADMIAAVLFATLREHQWPTVLQEDIAMHANAVASSRAHCHAAG